MVFLAVISFIVLLTILFSATSIFTTLVSKSRQCLLSFVLEFARVSPFPFAILNSTYRARVASGLNNKKASFGSFEQRNLVGEMAEKWKTLAMKLKDECSALDIGIVYFI